MQATGLDLHLACCAGLMLSSNRCRSLAIFILDRFSLHNAPTGAPILKSSPQDRWSTGFTAVAVCSAYLSCQQIALGLQQQVVKRMLRASRCGPDLMPSFPASEHRFLEPVTTGSEMTFCKLQGWSPYRSAYAFCFLPSSSVQDAAMCGWLAMRQPRKRTKRPCNPSEARQLSCRRFKKALSLRYPQCPGSLHQPKQAGNPGPRPGAEDPAETHSLAA